jgi:flagellar transcriptional activator FlhD
MSETPAESASTRAACIPDATSMVAETLALNIAYLSLAQQMLRGDRKVAMSRLGFSAEVADVLANLSVEQVTRLASSNQILCRFRFCDHEMLAALAEKVDTALLAPIRQAGRPPEIETAPRTE